MFLYLTSYNLFVHHHVHFPQFIGELYKLKMLSGRIMHQCVKKLLGSKDEESLESLCRLFTTIGKDLDSETNERIANASSKDEVVKQVKLSATIT
jgi:hypothetical protein